MLKSRIAYIFVLVLLHSLLNCDRAPFHADNTHDDPVHVHELVKSPHFDQADDGSKVFHADIHNHHTCHSGNSVKVQNVLACSEQISSYTPAYQSKSYSPLIPPPSLLNHA